MNWEIKEISSKNDFDNLEKFYKEKLSVHFHYRLSSDYLFWKLKRNKKFHGVMLVAVDNDKIIGSSSLTFKEACFGEEKKLIAEIGDAYSDIRFQRNILNKYKYKKKEEEFTDISIFGSLTKYLIKLANNKNIDLIYGVPNNTSYQGYTKNLKFKRLEKLNIYSYTVPFFKYKKEDSNYLKFANFLLKSYRILICKIFFRKFKIILDEKIDKEEINNLTDQNKKKFYLKRDQEYFYNKYKFHPEKIFKFCKIFKDTKLVGIYVLKEDLNEQKVYLVDCLVKKEEKFLTKFVALNTAVEKNFSVNFWDKNSNNKLIQRIIFNVFRRNKINIIYYNKLNFDENFFLDEFYIGFSDNF
tara:strand:- start:487 stop:1551 length:1065 start_codon:yes stop_codon:yes gene_type:complete